MSEGQTIGEAVTRSAEKLAKPDGGDTKTTSEPREPKVARETPRETPRETAQDDDAWEGEPGWVKQWKKPSQSALRRLARLEGANDQRPASTQVHSGYGCADDHPHRKNFQ